MQDVNYAAMGFLEKEARREQMTMPLVMSPQAIINLRYVLKLSDCLKE